MNSELCKKLGIEFPLFGFSHCRDVVAAVSKAGGMGVFGAVMYSPEQLREELAWIDANVNGKPYGVDVIIPNNVAAEGSVSAEQLVAAIPEQHRKFVTETLAEYDINDEGLDEERLAQVYFAQNLQGEGAKKLLDVVFEFPVKLVANALGMPPKLMIDMARERNVQVAALAGSKKHAQSQIDAGVDIIVASGGEAGGHCGEISTMVLVPEVVSIAGDIPVLAAGGIVTGRQMAASMAMGAAGAWCGSVWLTSPEAEPIENTKNKMLEASSSDTVRSPSRTGKNTRQLKSEWTEKWDSSSVKPMPMPFQSLLSEPAHRKIDKLADSGHEGAKKLSTYWVGQGVGLMNQTLSAGAIVQEFKEDYLAAAERLIATLEE